VRAIALMVSAPTSEAVLAVGELSRARRRVGNEFFRVASGQFRIYHQHERERADARNRLEILDRIVRQGLVQMWIGAVRGIRGHEQRVAVRRTARHQQCGNLSVRAGTVVHDHVLAETLR
jgi:hypothetical protein